MKSKKSNQIENKQKYSIIINNINEKIIIIKEEKTKSSLIKKTNNMKPEKDWKTPFGIFLTVISTLLTTDFKLFYYIEVEYIKVIFFVIGLISLILSIKKYFFK